MNRIMNKVGIINSGTGVNATLEIIRMRTANHLVELHLSHDVDVVKVNSDLNKIGIKFHMTKEEKQYSLVIMHDQAVTFEMSLKDIEPRKLIHTYRFGIRAAVQGCTVQEYLDNSKPECYRVVFNDSDGGVYVFKDRDNIDKIASNFFWDGNGDFDINIFGLSPFDKQFIDDMIKKCDYSGNVQDENEYETLSTINFFSKHFEDEYVKEHGKASGEDRKQDHYSFNGTTKGF